MSRNSAGRPVFGFGSGFPGERVAAMRSIKGERLVVDGDHALAVELAERHFQPGAGAGNLMHAVEFEVEQFADAQPAGALEQQRAGCQLIR